MAVTEEPRAQAKRPPAPAKLIDPQRYTTREFARLEFERMWSRTWQLACLDTDIPNPGDFYEYVVGDWSIVVLRALDGSLRAFHNVCAHRGRRIKTGCGN
ncbi:MAG: Rieske 2Fe-2S domain-containing protein, partial [Actinobacteria bacterium]|nr:Rieske 2Fe-2S domain-containing protein [Actinomycetota bacterium]